MSVQLARLMPRKAKRFFRQMRATIGYLVGNSMRLCQLPSLRPQIIPHAMYAMTHVICIEMQRCSPGVGGLEPERASDSSKEAIDRFR